VNIELMRATQHWQKTGAYYVRIQGMAKQHGITLDKEFDTVDADYNTKYIVALDDNFPVATCRLFEKSPGIAEIGRVVVLEEYRGKGLGIKVVDEAESWAKELGYSLISIESRDVAVGFYEKLGYKALLEKRNTGTFDCIHMEKYL